jgi:nitronate monooxygenase
LIPVKVIQAPIGSVATVDLVSEVCNAGGVGSLGASWTTPHLLRERVNAIRQRTSNPFAVNLVNAFEHQERIATLEILRVPIVWFSWGVRLDFIRRMLAVGSDVWQQVSSVESAERAMSTGVSALIAQGIEAGGHVEGTQPTLALVTQLRNVGIPVFAAGGIGDVANARRAIEAGASGVVLGTRFVASRESGAHMVWKDAIVSAQAPEDTFHGIVFNRGWEDAPHRVIENSTVRMWKAAGALPPQQARPGDTDIVGETAGLQHVRYGDDVPQTDTTGNPEAMALYAGTSALSIQDVESAADIVRQFQG